MSKISLCDECYRSLSEAARGSDLTATFAKSEDSGCSVCLGFWSNDFRTRLNSAVKKALEPYGAATENCFSRKVTPPTLNLPADQLYRFWVALEKAQGSTKQVGAADSYGLKLKQTGNGLLLQGISKLELSGSNDLPSCVRDEEQGHLCVHVVVAPRKDIPRPACLRPQQASKKKRRKRDFDSQGGDPKANLENRLQSQGIAVWSINKLLNASSIPLPCDSDKDLFVGDAFTKPDALQIHVAVWRRPFYLKACYTKTRRDVSQTPFFVADQGQKRRRLGVTSVEEQILPVVSHHSGGISTINNDPASNSLLFGMAKFHASGREDMDVRMLLPADDSDGDNGHPRVTGRPFVCEIIDSFRLPTVSSLKAIVDEVNAATTNIEAGDEPRSYGKNSFGVGISAGLCFTPSSSFKNLQAETENKVKHYGALCWSKEPLPATDDDLNQRLGDFPLTLQQRTPIRVMHRRANAVRERHVLTCKAQRKDDHYFHLHLSTSAGTYVKEFCHGDLGRTVPSLSTLLGCKTDILELDCEGIQAS